MESVHKNKSSVDWRTSEYRALVRNQAAAGEGIVGRGRLHFVGRSAGDCGGMGDLPYMCTGQSGAHTYMWVLGVCFQLTI